MLITKAYIISKNTFRSTKLVLLFVDIRFVSYYLKNIYKK